MGTAGFEKLTGTYIHSITNFRKKNIEWLLPSQLRKLKKKVKIDYETTNMHSVKIRYQDKTSL